jgi:hypothetical protein
VWGSPLGWVFTHESAHTFGLVPSNDPHWDGGVHSKDQFIDPTEATFGYDVAGNRAWSSTMYDIMYPSGSGNENSYGLNSWDWEFLRQKFATLPSTGTFGPRLPIPRLHGLDMSPNAAVASNTDGTRTLFAAKAGVLHYKRELTPYGAWSDWTSMGTNVKDLVRTQTYADGRVAVFIRWTDNRIYGRVQVSPGGAFGSWFGFGSLEVKGFKVGKNVDGRLEVLAVGTDGVLRTSWQTSANGSFSAFASLDGWNLSSELEIARHADGRLEVFVVGGDGVVYRRAQSAPASGPWTGWSNLLATGMPKVKELHAANSASGAITLAMMTESQSIIYRRQLAPNGGTWGPVQDLWGSALKSGFSFFENADGRLEVLVVGGDGTLYNRWQQDPEDPERWVNWNTLLTGNWQGGIATTVDKQHRLDVFGVGVSGWTVQESRNLSTIQVVGGSYGSNCGIAAGGDSQRLRNHCEGESSCAYFIDPSKFGDPAMGCSESYVAQWRCNDGTVVKTATLANASGSAVTLSCP